MGEWNKKRLIMRRYDVAAHIYDMRYAEEQTAKIKVSMQFVDMKKDSIVLDVGCGTGLLFKYVADKANIIVGLDMSRLTLLEARKASKDFSNIHLIQADADNMPFKDSTFHYVFAVTLIQNMPNSNRTLTEIKRVAKKNATIVVTALKKKFTLKTFEKLLHKHELKMVEVQGDNLQCHVAVCIKLNH